MKFPEITIDRFQGMIMTKPLIFIFIEFGETEFQGNVFMTKKTYITAGLFIRLKKLQRRSLSIF